MRPCTFLLFLLVLTVLVPCTTEAQSRTSPVNPEMWNENLEIGPVSGLSTVWHAAPVETGVPLHETLRFRVRVPQSTRVVWEGAREVERSGAHSVAEVRLDAPGERTVRMTWTHLNGPEHTETAVLRGVDTDVSPITLSPIRVSVDRVEIDPDNPNASTMYFFFRGESIAPLVEVGLDHYRTSVSRRMTLAVDVQPAALAPLVEWSLDGRAQKQLGAQVQMLVFAAREHEISAGGETIVNPRVRLDTYRVRITQETRDQRVLDGVPVTYRAETDPPGYESEILWMASTKYGTCSPGMGTGPEFTTVFDTTLGDQGRWLGVRAANSTLGIDSKGSSGIFRGSLVTEAVNVGLELDITEKNNCIVGTWTLTGDEGQELSSGTVFGTRTGQSVSLPLSQLSDTVLVGQISADGASLSGTVQEDGSTIGTWITSQCPGPDLVIELPGLNVDPPASLCSLKGSGNPLVIKNRGPGNSPATQLRGTLTCADEPVDIDVLPVDPLAAGATDRFTINIPFDCLITSISLTIDPVEGECSTQNTVSTLCPVIVAP